MSRRPQILHVTDSANSRQRNRTYTKNTVLKATATSPRRQYDISDWETYSVVSLPGDATDDAKEDAVGVEEDAVDAKGQVENMYATIAKRKGSTESGARQEGDDVFDVVDLAGGGSGAGLKTLDPLRDPRQNSTEATQRSDCFPVKDGRDKEAGSSAEEAVEEVVEEDGELKEIHDVASSAADRSPNADDEGKKPLTKEKSVSMLNLNSSDQCRRIRFKKLGSKIETQVNNFNRRRQECAHAHAPEGSINRSMPEFLDANFAIENPLVRFKAIESHLEHISKTNHGVKPAVDKNVNAPPGRDKLTNATKSVNLRVIDRSHEKVGKSKSNEESKSASEDSFRKVAAFDGLLQYLQDYRLGLRDLLVNNNVVVIEPLRGESPVRLEDAVRRKPPPAASETSCRITGATVKNGKPPPPTGGGAFRSGKAQPKIKRHFFYHPCNRVNRYLVDKELPDPDLVKNGREKYEEFLKLKIDKEKVLAGFGGETLPGRPDVKCVVVVAPPMESTTTPAKRKLCRFLTVDTVFRDKPARRWTDTGSLSSGISSDLSCYDTDLESPGGERAKTPFSSDDDDDRDSVESAKNSEVEYHQVAPEVLEKIRACGESTTYYGGRIVASTKGRSPINLIMSEIREDAPCGRERNYLGVKFRLVKSNSCGSRLELTGTDVEATAKESDGRSDSGDKRRVEFGGEDSGKACLGIAAGVQIGDAECEATSTGTSAGAGEGGTRRRDPVREEIPKIDIRRAIKEIEAKRQEATGSTGRLAKRTGSFQLTATSSKDVGAEKTNFLGGPPLEAARGGRGTRAPLAAANGVRFGGAVCDMEFETFQVLESLPGCRRQEDDAGVDEADGKTKGEGEGTVIGGKEPVEMDPVLKEKIREELKAEMDKMQGKEAAKDRVPMTSWSKQRQSVTFDFRNERHSNQTHLPAANHSLC